MPKPSARTEHVVAIAGVAVGLVAVGVSVWVAIGQARLTREALRQSQTEMVFAQTQARASACHAAGATYAQQAWAYGMIPRAAFERHGLPPNTAYYEGGPNQLLIAFADAAIAAGRAIQLCTIRHDTVAELRSCLSDTVNIDAHRVDDDRPLDGVVDGLVC